MVRLVKFLITLHDGKQFYRPGDEVTGQLEIQLDSEMEIKEILLKFAGKAYVQWTQGKKNYWKEEKFFAENNVVYGGGDSHGEHVSLRQGVHQYPFRFQLPQPLASSYKDEFGFIKYYVKARIVKLWQIDDKTTTEIFVVNTLDLNHLSDMMVPSIGSESKILCCCCCASGPIEGEIHLDRHGYVPGEWIIANATLENHSSSRVRMTSIEIVRIVTYCTDLRDKTEITTIAKVTGPPCEPRRTVTLADFKLQLPQVTPPESAHCSVLDIKYAVMLMAHLRTFAVNLRVYAPITVGTIALNSVQTAGLGKGFAPPGYTATTTPSFEAGKSNESMSAGTRNTKGTYYDWNQSNFTPK